MGGGDEAVDAWRWRRRRRGGGTVLSVDDVNDGLFACTGTTTVACGMNMAESPTKTGNNAWTGPNSFGSATSTIPYKTGTSLPVTCAVGEKYWHSTFQVEFACPTTDYWTPIAGAPGKYNPIIDEMCGNDNYPDASIYGERWFRAGSIADNSVNLADDDHPCVGNGYVASVNGLVGIALRNNSSDNDEKFGNFGGWSNRTGEYHWVFHIGDAAQVVYRIGMSSSLSAAAPTNGVYAQFASNSGCTLTGSDTGWTYHSRVAGTSTTDTGPTVTAYTWYHLRIRSVTAGIWLFAMSTNGGSFSTEKSLTSALTSKLAPVFQVTACDTNYKYISFDLFKGIQLGGVR